jgi:flagellum-specific peptidoglycan hydrolase FlgJ
MVLTAQEADVYRKNKEKQAILTHNAQQTQALRNKLATQENLHALRESAPALLERFKSLATAPTSTDSSGGSGVVASSGPIDEELMFSGAEGFFKALAPAAKQGEQEYGVFAAVTLAQAALESGWGKSKVAQSDKNLFGIKYTGNFAPGLNVTQGRNCPGNESGGARPYNRYESFGDSIIDHGWFLKNNPRYTKAGAFNAKNAKEQIQAIANAGYAEDPNYAKSLIKMIDSYNLTQYKQGTPYVPDDQIALLHKGEMVVPKEFNPASNGKVLNGEDLGEIIKLLKWGFDFLGKKLSEEKIVQTKSTNKQQLRSLKDPYQDFNLGW